MERCFMILTFVITMTEKGEEKSKILQQNSPVFCMTLEKFYFAFPHINKSIFIKV